MATLDLPRVRRLSRRKLWAHGPLALVAVVTMVPFLMMIVMSFRYNQAITFPRSLLPVHLNLQAYRQVLANGQFPRWFLNTAIYAVTSVVLVLLFASIAAYAFAKKRFPGQKIMFWTFIAMLMVPYQLTLIPQFILVSKLGLVDTMTGLILPTLANAQALFLMRQFILGIPDELLEAARIDGAGELTVFFRIVLPQCRPILATLGVFVFMWHWNDFLWPLVNTRTQSNYVLTLGLYSMQAQNPVLAVTMAAAVLTFVPILVIYIVLQRHFIAGVTMSGMK
ncbi:MAG: carbohydrate ABC transporter permease [Microlunatus sp.]|nr:carbohydrate ABC transporter permease [Microlunatus sp.]